MSYTAHTEDWYANLSRPCPVRPGTRVRVLYQPNDPCPVESGTEGTVTGGNGSQIYVDWDNGRSLILLTTDYYEVISQ